MISITVESLQQHTNELASLLGKEFVTDALDCFSTEGLTPHEVMLAEARCHPFAPYWHALKLDTGSSTTAGKLLLSNQSLFALNLYSDLRDLRDPRCINAVRIVTALQNPGTFFSAAFEAHVAARYLIRYGAVTVQNEGSGPTCDFLVPIKESTEFHIECKSLEDEARSEHRLWANLQNRLASFLMKSAPCFRISIQAHKRLGGGDVDVLYSEVRQIVLGGRYGRHALRCGATLVIDRIAEKDRVYEGPLEGRFGGDKVLVQAEIQPTSSSHYRFRNPSVIDMRPFFTDRQENRIKKVVQHASRQLTKGKLNIVHVEIPYRLGDRLLAVADASFDTVERHIRKNHSRIKAVILSGMSLNQRPDESAGAFLELNYVVPNTSCDLPLPADVSLFGISEKLEVEISEEGTIVIGFFINTPLPEQQGRALYYRASPDGRQQVRLWQTFHNHFRAEIISPQLGRRFVDADLNDLAPGVRNELALAWRKNQMDLYVNGAARARRDFA